MATGNILLNITFRWVILTFFATSLIASGFCMVGFSPVGAVLAEIYEAPAILVNLCVLLYLIAFLPANFIVIKVLDVYGIRTCVRTQIP